ncbi:MAG: 6-phospho-beta-galactosidase [Chlamydiia bacterium]|nr:6-phospho-beta-galactosidase [Chlamydiia bacterium]MCH9616591.1 6-phospho-beta-galactosidase [Chlamydiia bacterium]MCH9629321.1 6-phospho-beta-galactosidase [Chlamydiia bacterium]
MSDLIIRTAIDIFCPIQQNKKWGFFRALLGYAKKVLYLPILIVVIPHLFIKWAREHYRKRHAKGFSKVVNNHALWSDIDVKQTQFPKEMKFGIASSHYQFGGASVHPESHWNNPELFPCDQATETPRSLAELTQGGRDLWENPERVINTLRKIGVNSFRVSLPEELWDSEEAVLKYREHLCLLREAGIKPLVTLHHFSHPKDFDFLENPDRFLDFADRMHAAFSDLVTEWCTINEPAVFAVSAYFRGVFPPCKVNFKKMAKIMLAMIKCHNEIYKRFKARDPQCTVGFSHDEIHFRPYHWWNPAEQVLCYFLTHVFSEAYLGFYKSGKFWVKLPFLLNYAFEDPDFAKNNGYLDVIQLQCYTRPLLTVFPVPDSVGYPGEAMTHMRFREDPAALHTAMHRVYAATKKPVSITEFGCTTHDEEQRKRFIERALYAISKAHEDGIPLHSIHGWSFYGDRGEHGAYHEWNEDPERQDFGLCSYTSKGDHYPLRPAAECFRDAIFRSRSD